MKAAEELRRTIIDTVTANGGHLASSLGAVEIALALKATFDPERDRIVWDVGHQAYAWKLLTGRRERFSTLRQLDGISGFPNPSESAADAAVAGHAGVALSVASGLAAARDRLQADYQVVAVVGDGALANGTSFEALNHCSTATRKLILVLNDNEMSISGPVGALSKLFGRLLASQRYNSVKRAAENAGHRLRLTFLSDLYHKVESRLKGLLVGSRFFEQFGFRYIGPVDGHDLKALTAAFSVARNDKRSVVVHVATRKGKGYAPAEADPVKWHGISGRGAEASGAEAPRPSWSAAFGTALIELARRDGRIVALTAGMQNGTGLDEFASQFPGRCFDVGIAEGHMVAMAAGLAAGGLRPVVAVYSTFLQRAVDQVMHDVCISRLPVVFCVDRAGVTGADGVTHQGVFDYAMLKALPNLTICQPADEAELRQLLAAALKRPGPTVIRYPRGQVAPPFGAMGDGLAVQLARPEAKVQLWAAGDQLAKAQAVAAKTGAGVVYARYLKPFDRELRERQRARGQAVVSLENGAVLGGFGESLGAELRLGWPDEFIPHGPPAALERRYRLDADSVAAAAAAFTEKVMNVR